MALSAATISTHGQLQATLDLSREAGLLTPELQRKLQTEIYTRARAHTRPVSEMSSHIHFVPCSIPASPTAKHPSYARQTDDQAETSDTWVGVHLDEPGMTQDIWALAWFCHGLNEPKTNTIPTRNPPTLSPLSLPVHPAPLSPQNGIYWEYMYFVLHCTEKPASASKKPENPQQQPGMATYIWNDSPGELKRQILRVSSDASIAELQAQW